MNTRSVRPGKAGTGTTKPRGLDETVIAHRLDLQAQIIRLLLTMLPDQRHRNLKEEPIVYEADEII